MSTKTTTDTSSNTGLQFDPTALSSYQGFIKSASPFLQGLINNPFGNAFYTQGLQNSVRGAQQQGMNAQKVLGQNMKLSGLGGAAGNAFQQAQLGKIGRSTLAGIGNANVQNVQGALGRQLTAAQTALSFNPLLTGEHSTGHSVEQKSGLGTWLPQLAGSAINAGLGFATGGLSSASGFGGGSGFAGFNPVSPSYASPTSLLPSSPGTNPFGMPYSAGLFG